MGKTFSALINNCNRFKNGDAMKLNYLLILLLLTALIAEGASVNSTNEAVELVEKTLLPQGKDNVGLSIWGPVNAGTSVRASKEFLFNTPAPGYVVYIDDYPAANLFHPVRYAFVDSETGEIKVFNAQSQPFNFDDYTYHETEIGNILRAAVNRRAPIPHNPQLDPPYRSDRYAVLLNGGASSGSNHVRYWNDLSNIYITIRHTYGFPEENIFVLCSDGLNPAPDQSNGQNSDPDLDGDGDPDIMYPCVQAAIDAVFDSLAGILTDSDKLFIFTTDHGGSNGGWNTLQNLWNGEEMTDAHFAGLLSMLPQCEIICTLEPCFSGGFLDNIVVAPGPVIASSACRHDEYSWAMPPDYMYDAYVFHWTAAVKGEDAYGNPADADYNGDGIISMEEAFTYAEIHDLESEEPQYGDFPAGLGAGVSLWPTGNGPMVSVTGQTLDDIGGNNNNAADPGETVSIILTLGNYGNEVATNIIGTLSTTDTYLTMTQNISYYPNLGSFEQGAGSPEYTIDISEECPQGYTASCDLLIEADSAYTNDASIYFVVGDIINTPCGPDQYGYFAYDPFDVPELPVYDWVELSPDSGGPGTPVPFTVDDQVLLFALPFDFVYYGQSYDSLTIACNGWISMGIADEDDYSNSGIPTGDGPEAMIAPYWEDLSPQRANSGGVWQWYDAVNHRYIVEYNHVEQYAPTGDFETFQVILYNPLFHQTETGDGKIKMQYKDMSASLSSEGTIGIENHWQTDGIQYLYDGDYSIEAHPIENESCLLFVPVDIAPDLGMNLIPENPPIVIPAAGGSFGFYVEIENPSPFTAEFDVWSMVTLPSGEEYGPLLNRQGINLGFGAAISRDLTQNIPGGAPEGYYTYSMYAGVYEFGTVFTEESFEFEKSGVDAVGGVNNWNISGWDSPKAVETGLPSQFALHAAFPNPFNPVTTLNYYLPEAGKVSLVVYDITGREVAKLVDGHLSSGEHSAVWDAADFASGIYFARLDNGKMQVTQKMLLIK